MKVTVQRAPIQNIVHYVDSDTFGGCEEMVIQILGGLDRTRWAPVFFYHDSPGLARLIAALQADGIRCQAVPLMNSLNSVGAIMHFARQLRLSKAEIFHAHLNWPLGCRQALFAARIARVPSIIATAQLYAPIDGVRFSRAKQWLQAACLHRYIAVSGEVQNRFCHELGVPPAKIQIVRNGIRLTSFLGLPDPALRSALIGNENRPIIFTPARLHSQKGHEYLLKAAAQVPDAIFVLAGDGPDRVALESLAQTLGIGPRVRFLGQRRDIPALLAVCDVFVLPSLYEGLPLSVLEAMAAGKPVIATSVGGTDEAVISEQTGLLVPPANSDELAKAIRRLLEDKPFATRLAVAGKERAHSSFSSEAAVAGISRIYEELRSHR